ncbi:MAG TPA: helix-turn-helix domain-containing protein [Acidimicrobiales bacterium]|nr:helix-turn-helix domain-containing protein [Acidimicrobiales bacterium]
MTVTAPEEVLPAQPLKLGAAQRQLARHRIYQATWAALAERGLSVTVEDVAARAGLSMRTVFRHFGTRDRLVAEALRAQLRSYKEGLPPPGPNEALVAWLRRTIEHVHQYQLELGRAYWEMTAPGRPLEGEIAAIAAGRRRGRVVVVKWAAATAWQKAGGEGRPPAWLVDAFAIHLSGFTIQALVEDLERSPAQVAKTSATALDAAIRAAVAAS